MQNRVIKDVRERGEIGPSHRLFQEELVHLGVLETLTSLQGPQRVKDFAGVCGPGLLHPEGGICLEAPSATLPTSTQRKNSLGGSPGGQRWKQTGYGTSVPRPVMETRSPALEGRVLSTGPPRKSPSFL